MFIAWEESCQSAVVILNSFLEGAYFQIGISEAEMGPNWSFVSSWLPEWRVDLFWHVCPDLSLFRTHNGLIQIIIIIIKNHPGASFCMLFGCSPKWQSFCKTRLPPNELRRFPLLGLSGGSVVHGMLLLTDPNPSLGPASDLNLSVLT